MVFQIMGGGIPPSLQVTHILNKRIHAFRSLYLSLNGFTVSCSLITISITGIHLPETFTLVSVSYTWLDLHFPLTHKKSEMVYSLLYFFPYNCSLCPSQCSFTVMIHTNQNTQILLLFMYLEKFQNYSDYL